MDTIIRIPEPNKLLGRGGMRACFDVEDVDEEGAGTAMVAKMFRHNISHVVRKDYFNEGEAQCMCEEFARNFNRIRTSVPKRNISFLQCYVVCIPVQHVPSDHEMRMKRFFTYKTEDTHEVMFVMEPKLKGHFTKYNSNYGDTFRESELDNLNSAEAQLRHDVYESAEAFSHFTLAESGGSMLVCDLQGVNDFLTDPQIHTEDGKGLGMGNMGQAGIDKWVEKHECNSICSALGLQPLRGQTLSSVPNGRQSNYYVKLRAKLQSHIPVRPEELVPLSKPLDQMTDEEYLEYAIKVSAIISS